MTPIDKTLEALDVLLEKATDGPWARQSGCVPYVVRSHGQQILRCYKNDNVASIDREANAALIVALVNAYPALREEIERLKSAVERLGSMEAFTSAHIVDQSSADGRELIARVEFARRTLQGDEDNG
jgi:hypothetical protein